MFNSPNDNTPGHAIMLVGWDDSYSKENFIANNQPQNDGAWLVKNSYLESGYYWLSYEEGSLTNMTNSVCVINGVEKASSNQRMLSYDYFPSNFNKNYYFIDSDVYFCNVFDVSDYVINYNHISKVMFYLKSTGCTYEVKIVQLDSEGNLPENIDNYLSLASGSYSGEGYITADLQVPYSFVSSNKCAIILKLSPLSDNKRIYIPYEYMHKSGFSGTNVDAEINSGESFFGVVDDSEFIDWTDCNESTAYCMNGKKGNLIIRPVLSKSTVVPEEVTITPDEILDTGSDVAIQIDSNAKFIGLHTSSNYILRQDIDYLKTSTGITLKSDYIESLDGSYTELICEFNNDTTKTIVVNPKSTITNVTLSGKTIVGDILTATCVGEPEKSEYDVNYQWQSSLNGINWYDISGATSSEYTITDNNFNRYLRVKITSNIFGNVVYPTEIYSDSTLCKIVILGDVNLDGIVAITDCTDVQKYLANTLQLNNEQLLAADANRDGVINVKDVTAIQKIILSQ